MINVIKYYPFNHVHKKFLGLRAVKKIERKKYSIFYDRAARHYICLYLPRRSQIRNHWAGEWAWWSLLPAAPSATHPPRSPPLRRHLQPRPQPTPAYNQILFWKKNWIFLKISSKKYFLQEWGYVSSSAGPNFNRTFSKVLNILLKSKKKLVNPDLNVKKKKKKRFLIM